MPVPCPINVDRFHSSGLSFNLEEFSKPMDNLWLLIPIQKKKSIVILPYCRSSHWYNYIFGIVLLSDFITYLSLPESENDYDDFASSLSLAVVYNFRINILQS
jgi:hypothetical protein